MSISSIDNPTTRLDNLFNDQATQAQPNKEAATKEVPASSDANATYRNPLAARVALGLTAMPTILINEPSNVDTIETPVSDKRDEIKQLLKLLALFEKNGLFDRMNEAQMEALEAVARTGSLENLAMFLFENTGFNDDPAVEATMKAIFSDGVIDLTDIEQLGTAMLDSQAERIALLGTFLEKGLFDRMDATQMKALETIARTGSLEDLAIFLFENTGFNDDPAVEATMEKIFADGVIDLTDIERLGTAMLDSQADRIALLETFIEKGLFDRMDATQMKALETIARTGSLEDLAVFLFENTGFSDDPAVEATMEKIFADGVINLTDIERLGTSMLDSQADRIALLETFLEKGLFDRMDATQMKALETIARTGSLEDLAVFLFENSGFRDDPAVEATMEKIFADGVIDLADIKRLGVAMLNSQTDRMALLEAFGDKGLFHRMDGKQLKTLESIARTGSLEELAVFLFE